MATSWGRHYVTGYGLAAALVMWGLSVPGATGANRLTVKLPDGILTIPLTSLGGSPYLALEPLAEVLAATVLTDSEGSIGLRWGGRDVRFTPDHREVRTSGEAAMLSAPARRQGSVLWLPVDAAAIAARERFGANRVRWDAGTQTLTVAGSGPAIRAIRVGLHPDRTRVVLEATGPVDWAVTEEGDGRLVVTLPGSGLSEAIVRREYKVGLLRAVEPVQAPNGAWVRLAFAGRADQARWFALKDPFRIVVDLHRSVPSPAPSGAAEPSGSADGVGSRHGVSGAGTPLTPEAIRSPAGAARSAPGAGKTGAVAKMAAPARSSERQGPPAAPPVPAPDAGPPQPPQPSLPASPGPDAPPSPERGVPLTIVIDPGHGGKDTGAIGPRGLKEKDVVLDIGLHLRRLLTDRLGARVIVTRADDTFLPLEERTAIANRARADFFISLHVNAAPQARATGVETYYLSQESSDLSARASAARENLVLNLEGISPREQDSLKAVLWDMAETLHVKESSAMAEMLLDDLGRGLGMDTRGVKHGPFVVLMTAGMPSALVEVAFISNPSQERRLQENTYRHSIALALSEGIARFAQRYQRRIGMQPSRLGPS